MPTTELPQEPAPDNPARLPKRAATEEELKDLAEALARPEVNGNIAAAAAVLKKKYPDAPYMRWYKLSKSNEYLRSFHPGTPTDKILPGPADAIDRAPLPPAPLLSPVEVAEAKAVTRQAELLKAGDWKSIGLSDEQAHRMVSMERFSRNPLKQMADATHGGLIFAYANGLEIYDKALEAIKNPETEVGAKGETRSRQAVVRDNMYVAMAISAELRQVSKQISHSLLVMQKVNEMQANAGGEKKRGKPGFGAMVAIKAEAGASVTISDGSNNA